MFIRHDDQIQTPLNLFESYFCCTQNPNYHAAADKPMPIEYKPTFPLCTHPQAKRRKTMFICTTHRAPHLPPSPRLVCAAGLRPRGDESDQSDQSTEITVIPEVRGRAPGHSEFTHPSAAPDKSLQEWQTFGRTYRTVILWKD